MPRIAQLRQLVTLQSPSLAQDAYGEPITTWTPQAVVWAQIVPVAGREEVRADRVVGAADAEIIIRHRTDVQITWRAVHNADIYEINAIQLAGGRNFYQKLLCRKMEV